MSFKFANNASAKLASAITSGDLSLNVVAGQGAQFPTLSGGDTFRATLQSSTALEIVEVTARSTDAFTIVRAKEGTTAVAFAAGDTIELRLTKELMEAWFQRSEIDTDATMAANSDTKIASQKATKTALALKATLASPTFTGTPAAPTAAAGTNSTQLATAAYADNAVAKQPEVFMFAVSDETTALTTGTAKLTFRMPFACSMTALPRANVNTVSSSGLPTFDIKKNGTTIFSTTLTIDASEKTSVTAATPAVLTTSPTTFADDDEITIDINTAGTGTKGAKITMSVVRT